MNIPRRLNSAERVERGELDAEERRGGQDRDPGRNDGCRDHGIRTFPQQVSDRCVNGVSAPRAHDTHVQDVRPERQQTSIIKENGLDQQDKRDRQTTCPRPPG